MAKFSFIASLLAIGLSVCSFCITEKHNDLSYDNLNFLVAILAIIITILSAWQIFNILNWENKLKKEVENQINKKTIELTKKIDIIHNVVEKISTTIYEKTNMYLEYLKNEKEEKKK